MTTLTEMVAVVLVQSSAAAYSHFGVTLEPVRVERPVQMERSATRPAAAPKVAQESGRTEQPRTGPLGS